MDRVSHCGWCARQDQRHWMSLMVSGACPLQTGGICRGGS